MRGQTQAQGRKHSTDGARPSWGRLGRGIERARQVARVVLISTIYDVVVGTWKFTLLFIFNGTCTCLSQRKIENIIRKTVNWHSHCASFVIILGPAVLVQRGASSAGESLNTETSWHHHSGGARRGGLEEDSVGCKQGR